MKCKVILLNGNGGATFVSEGELTTLSDGIEVAFFLDGDGCFLKFSGGVALYSRSGGVELNMRLIGGSTTDCSIGAEGFSGSVPVYCEEAGLKKVSGGYEINLSYIFCGEKTNMKVTVLTTKGV